jgi:diadenosine tetraphosphate (Ap4A) HIT family hydrolase
VPTLFTRIIDGEIPGEFVWRDDQCVAFLSINPLSPGHTLVLPRSEIDHWLDCPAGLRDHLMGVAQTVGQAIQRAFAPERVGLIIAGFEVAHLHIHVFAAHGLADFDFGHAGQTTPGEMAAAGDRIRAALPAP